MHIVSLNEKKSISVVVPLFNEEKSIRSFHKSLVEVLSRTKLEFEIVYVDDGSIDDTANVINKFKDKRVKLVALSRNFGKEIALSAGVATGKYEAIIMLDGDGQHPVELIPEFISQWQSGSDVVIGLRKASSGRSALGRLNSYLFYKLFNKLSEDHRMTRFLIDWLGFDRSYVNFDAKKREHGEASYSTGKLINLAFNSMISSSPKPLYFFAYLGVMICLLSLFLGIAVILEQLILSDPLGWKFTGTAMLGILIIFLVGIVLMSQGIISVYISRIHNQSKGRPLYVVNKRKSVGLSSQKILKHKS